MVPGNQTAVYNVEPTAIEDALATVLDSLGLLWSRCGHDYLLRRPLGQPAQLVSREGSFFVSQDPPSTPQAVGESDLPVSEEPIRVLCLELDVAPVLHHVTLQWGGAENPSLRKQVEHELAQVLARVPTQHNPLGNLLLMVSGLLLSTSFLFLVGSVVYRILHR